jgi:hypothetical protein
MLSGIERELLTFAHQTLQMLPYGGVAIEGFPIGELAWFAAIVIILGEVYLMIFRKKGFR